MRLTVLFFIICSTVFSQKAEVTLEDQVALSFNFTSFHLSYDKAITNKISVGLGVGVGAGFYATDNSLFSETGMSLPIQDYIPIRIIQRNRIYYNRVKRSKKNKSLENNSGNYFGLQFMFNTGKANLDIENPPHNSLLSELHWGLQRSLGGNWIFDFNLGIGYLKDFDTDVNRVIPTLGLTIGYRLL